MNLQNRIQKILDLKFRIFKHPDFDNPEKSNEILQEMPDLEAFQAAKVKVSKLRSEGISPEMRPCYEEPLLKDEQEMHLFKKMHFLRHQIVVLRKDLIQSDLQQSIILLQTLENYLTQSEGIRNQIASCNLRLATQIFKNNKNFLKNSSEIESLLSDAYLDVFKAVDYFDYTKNIKFSTYCTWVLKKNYSRSRALQKKDSDKYKIVDDQNSIELSFIENVDIIDNNEISYKLSKLIEETSKKRKSKNPERELLILEHYFGLNGKPLSNLEQISKKLKVTKERVRQIKEKFLISMKEIAVAQDFNFDF